MKVSEYWLREWADPAGGTAALVHQLTMQGLEVDEAVPVGGPLPHVVAGRVLSVAAHPDADRLRVCQVDSGEGTLQVVCGAANVREGGVYPLAMAGASLPGGLRIRRSRLRGVPSEGMLCSAVELGIAEHAEGLLELDSVLVPGTSVAGALALEDVVLDINVTPNRADCFSIVGIARDIAAVAGLPFRDPAPPAVAAQIEDTFPVRIEDEAGCSQFCGRVIRGIDPRAQTPLWMVERLRRCGIRAISPVVDVTNYVMLELGQPLHAYDRAFLQGAIRVRRARPGERLRLLGGTELALDPDVLVIADDRGAIGMAGIMGGEGTGVGPATCDVFLESAHFPPAAVVGRARRHGLQTDASMRFERGVDPAAPQPAIERATALLVGICGGQPGPVSVGGVAAPAARSAVRLRPAQIPRVLGLAIGDAEVEASLARLGMQVSGCADGSWLVTPPTHRFDIAIEVDLLEELARLAGYDAIPEQPGTRATTLGNSSESSRRCERLRAIWVDRGYQEVVTWSFGDAASDAEFAQGGGAIDLVNPISAELATLRRSLWPGLVRTLLHNQARQVARLRAFEVGRVYHMQDGHPVERAVIGGIAGGPHLPEQWGEGGRKVDFHDVKADIEALFCRAERAVDLRWIAAAHPALQPGRSARIERQGRLVGWLGVMHPRLVAARGMVEAPLLFELDLDECLRTRLPTYQPVSRYPAVRRDLAVLVARDVPVVRLLDTVRAAAGVALRDVFAFDVYAGERIESGKKSVALGLILQETSRTLTDVECDAIVAAAVSRLTEELGARIRT